MDIRKERLYQFWNPICKMWALCDAETDKVIEYREQQTENVPVIPTQLIGREPRTRKIR
jgi:hypothetical protein